MPQHPRVLGHFGLEEGVAVGPAATALAVMREQRHRFLNHLQVLSGWLQLGDPAQAARYLDRAVAELQAEGALSRLEPPELALALVRAHWAALDLGVAIRWQLAGPLPGPLPLELVPGVAGLVERAAAAEARRPAPDLTVAIGPGPAGWELVLRGPAVPADPELAAMARRLGEAGLPVRLEGAEAGDGQGRP